jgi:fructose-bisphosphate aldolase, class II
MIAKPNKLFKDALKGGYAIGAFNTSNLEVTQAIVAAAEDLKSPVIVQTSEGALEYGGVDVLTGIVRQLSEENSVPIILHLDHGKSMDMIKRCIEAGYTSVMIDASKEPFEDNIKKTLEVVEYAHARGVWVEAELGAIMGSEGMKELDGEATPDSWMTDPKEVEIFIKETGADALAVSVGTIHGAFTGQEYIRFELIEEIEKKALDVPLVLHGASGIAADRIKEAVKSNVCKVNIDTELRIAFTDSVKAYFDETHDKLDPRKILGPAREAVKGVVKEKIQALGSAGKVNV